MRRIAILGAVVGVAALVVRARGAQLRGRMMAHCEAMFEHMPDTFPPKQMMCGIEEIRDKSDQILALLQAEENAAASRGPDADSDEAVHHAA